ncbi:hypothetical protein IW262DRAFT_1466355 [Armillaria fumosa]|nr:hypothetical protein IW262DRAFT_1466355 [Armillaria fumosa]
MKHLRIFVFLFFTFSSFSLAVAADFFADGSIDAAGIYKAAATGLQSGKSIVDSYPASPGDAKIIDTWTLTDGVCVRYISAVQRVVGWYCPGNKDGQKETDFGAIDARVVPWYVLSNEFFKPHTDINPNALVAIVRWGRCTTQFFVTPMTTLRKWLEKDHFFLHRVYGLPQGWPQWREMTHTVRRTQYGLAFLQFIHTSDVSLTINLDIIFPSEVPCGVGKNTIDIGALKTLGDKQATLLAGDISGYNSNGALEARVQAYRVDSDDDLQFGRSEGRIQQQDGRGRIVEKARISAGPW